MPTTTTPPAVPVDAVVERLNDPDIAASLVALLDSAPLLSILAQGLNEAVARSDAIMESIASGLHDVRDSSAGAAGGPPGVPAFQELRDIKAELSEAVPAMRQILGSSMTRPDTIALLSMMGEAATEGLANARANHTKVEGAFSAMRSLKDPEVQRGLGVMIEIAKAIGRRVPA